MRRKIVLHVVQSLHFGGVESHMRIIANYAELSQFEHRFCAIAGGGAIEEELAVKGQLVSVLNKSSHIPSVSAVIALIRTIRSHSPVILHAHGAEANFHGLIAARISRVPICVAEEIGFPNHSFRARVVFKLVYKLADAVVAISEAVRQKVIELGETKSHRPFVLLNPINIQPERTAIGRSEVFEIGFVGRLEAIKNPLALVRAVAILRDRGLSLRLTIVGDGSQRATLEAEVAQLGLQGIVGLKGYDPNPFRYLSGVSLYVQPSLSEGFGLALAEAMSAGIPVLATAVGGTPEIISDGESGWLLSGTDPETIANQIGVLAAMDKAKLDAIGKCGRNFVIERFSPEVYFKRCDSFYCDLLPK